MTITNVAVVGAGILGSRHARVFHEMDESELVAVVDVDAARAEKIAQANGARAFTDLKQMLDRVAVDAVSIATPDHLHRDPVFTALNAGKHVLLEKPLATTADDARAIVAAVAASKRVAMVNFSQRYVSDHIWIKQQIDAGNIGAPRMVISVKFDTIYVPTGMIPGWSSQTSPIYFMSSHDLDMTEWFIHARPVEVIAREVRGTLDARGFAAHDGLNALIQFENGVGANFHSSWIHPNTYPRVADGYMQIIGSDGAIMYNNRTRTAEIFDTRGGQKVEFIGPHTADEVGGKITGAFVASLQHFLACIRDQREPDTSPRRALPIALAQAAVIESLKTGQPVAIRNS
ncbi:MAG: Gfo/Idh/MocA family oxidoreductase [Chloroflexi bacterium]|nr:Gfo/Idh/MocA family oxidoreductase [Chloroflexota bacterium]